MNSFNPILNSRFYVGRNSCLAVTNHKLRTRARDFNELYKCKGQSHTTAK